MWQRWNSTSKIFEKSSNDGASWTALGLDAAIITQGTFSDALLSSNVALRNNTNNWSVGQTLSLISPSIVFIDTSQVSPAGRWQIVDISNTFRIQKNTAAAGDYSTSTYPFILSSTDQLTLLGGITAGSGAVGIVDSTGKIPAISSTYFASLSGANLTALPAANLSGTITSATQDLITRTGTLVSGATGAGFTVALTTSTITGTLADARLSSNVPLINAVNVFSAVQKVSTAGGAVYSTETMRLIATGGSSKFVTIRFTDDSTYSSHIGGTGTILGLYGPNQSVTGIAIDANNNATFYTTGNFSWNAKTIDTVYLAASDGFVTCFATLTCGVGANTCAITGLTDASNPPTTERVKQSFSNIALVLISSITFPVKKGDYYKVASTATGTATVTASTMFWIPLGTNG